jgi:hypothetical protein
MHDITVHRGFHKGLLVREMMPQLTGHSLVEHRRPSLCGVCLCALFATRRRRTAGPCCDDAERKQSRM